MLLGRHVAPALGDAADDGSRPGRDVDAPQNAFYTGSISPGSDKKRESLVGLDDQLDQRDAPWPRVRKQLDALAVVDHVAKEPLCRLQAMIAYLTLDPLGASLGTDQPPVQVLFGHARRSPLPDLHKPEPGVQFL